jgi:predicted DNA-binding transcriptional regulator AlpA
MKPETIASIRMLASADPEVDAATIARIVAACEKSTVKRELISTNEVVKILGVSRLTIWKYVKAKKIHPIYYSNRLRKFDKAEIISFANNGAGACL